MPSTPQMLDEIKERVVAVCPGIMELSFGCEYKGKHGDIFIYVRKIDRVGGDVTIYGLLKRTPTNSTLYSCPKNQIKILGHQINLECVLKAMHKKSSCFAVSEGGYFLERVGEKFTDKYWNLTRPLSQQSPETIKFLHEILCPNSKQ